MFWRIVHCTRSHYHRRALSKVRNRVMVIYYQSSTTWPSSTGKISLGLAAFSPITSVNPFPPSHLHTAASPARILRRVAHGGVRCWAAAKFHAASTPPLTMRCLSISLSLTTRLGVKATKSLFWLQLLFSFIFICVDEHSLYTHQVL